MPVPSSNALQDKISSAAAQAGAAHDSTTDIAGIQTAFNAFMADIVWGAQGVQTVKTSTGTKTANFQSGTPWPILS